MPFDIGQAVIGLIVGAFACYLGWQGLNVWLKEIPVKSRFFNFLTTESEIREVMKALAAIICGIAVLSGLWLIIVVVSGWKIWIDTPLAAILILLGWRLCQKHADDALQAIGAIAATLGSFILLMATTMTLFRIFFWRMVFGF
ncbi:MAG: hypothetical protein PHO90_00790 [Candidatus Pacebacteria bacterium]|nr:hypothetical protein [Candidatus Paceibacterota bacterium]